MSDEHINRSSRLRTVRDMRRLKPGITDEEIKGYQLALLRKLDECDRHRDEFMVASTGQTVAVVCIALIVGILIGVSATLIWWHP